MFEFADTSEYTHMPFVAYSKTGEATYLFCKQVQGFWKIFYSIDGTTIHQLHTGLAEDATECSPTAEWENGNWCISFIAGGAESDRAFKLYKMIGLDGKAEPIAKADYGYYWNPRTVWGLRSNSFIVSDNGAETKYTIPEAEYIYRLSYIPEDPNQLLITGQNKDGDLFTWIYHLMQHTIHVVVADALTAYKCCLFKGRCFYATRNDSDGFEERHIVEANTVQYIELDKANILVEEVKKASMACVDCLRKHIAAALSYSKEVLNGHGAGATPDHRADLAGELINAEHHAEALSASIAERLRTVRKAMEKQIFQPTPEQLDTIRSIWVDTFNLSGCNCGK